MRKTRLMAGRILALCLAFTLGFFSAFGAIAGGIYFAFAELSIDKINQWGEMFGINIPVDQFVDQEAEKPATSLTLQDLILEIQELTTSTLTLEEMIERYGLLLPPDVIDKVPESVMNDVPFTALFTPEGMKIVMDSVTVADIMSMIPEELAGTLVSEPLRETMADRTLNDIIAMDMGYIFNGVELGYLTGVTYVLDENGEYQSVWADPANPTLPELIAPLDLGGILSKATSGGDVLEVIKNSIGDVAVQSILGTFLADVVMINNILGEVTLGDLIVLDEATGKHTIDINVAMEGRKVGSFLGYTEVEVPNSETGEVSYMWTDTAGKKVVGVTAKIADIYLTDFMNGTVSFDTILDDLVIADVLGYEKGENLPVFMHDNLENPLVVEEEIVVWYLGDTPADKIMNAFADKTLDWISTAVSTLKLADILGYYCYDGEWYIWNVQKVGGSDAIVLSPGTPIMSEIAGTSIDGLGSIENTLKDIKIGTLLGYESICDENGDHLYWSTKLDENGEHVKPTGITASVADLTINGLSNGDLQTTIDDITLADVLGYTQGEDGKWYKGETVVTGPMAALAGSKVGTISEDINGISIGQMLGHTPVYETDDQGNFVYDDNGNKVITHWVDSQNNEVSGIMGAFVDLSINDMKDSNKVQESIQHIKVADVMGLYEEDGVWYNSDGTKASGIMASLAGTEVGGISSKMQTITIGEMLNLHKEDGIWYNEDGSRTSSVIAALADASVDNLNEELNTMKLGEILGYVHLDAEDANANAGAGWYVYNETTDEYVKASGVTGALADSNLTNLEANLKVLRVGDVAGYTYNTEDGEWYNSNGAKASGILAELSDLTVDDLTKENALTEKIGNVKLADALGYTYDEDEEAWYDGETKLTGIMSALADKPINDMGSAVNELTIDQVLPGEKIGLLSIIPGNTPINDISTAINDSIMTTPLQFFIDQGLITFEGNTMNTLDYLCFQKEQNLPDDEKGKYIVWIDSIDESKDSYKDKYDRDFKFKVQIMGIETEISCPNRIPSWRTQPLQKAFGYLVELMAP